MLRAAEVLEWLCHPTLNPEETPLRSLAAAAYQLAGYPARAAGLLRASLNPTEPVSPIAAFLRNDFPSVFRALVLYWSVDAREPREEQRAVQPATDTSANQVRSLVEDEIASALGVFCAAMRWGHDDRIEASQNKLSAIAKFLLNAKDPYSWLLAKLVAEIAKTFMDSSLRQTLQWLPGQLDEAGQIAAERYVRQAYRSCKTQAWPSQARGIARLAHGDSFVLCTPTGSGKTTVAEIAILQSLFHTSNTQSADSFAPLVMYLVPKRALAAEVEAKLQRIIAPLSSQRIVITGLYGGIDWGPTDAWLTSEERTVLICTYEKAEALIRFLGPLFLGRLSLIVLDEAHMIQFDGKEDELRTAESRSLRLESLIARLFVHIPQGQSRIIALSAVAAGIEGSLAKWITGNATASPERTMYRSTRQLIGRIECMANRGFAIRYDLLDRASLRFDDLDGGLPFVPQAFPSHPPAPSFEGTGPEKRLRPYLFWAGMHLAAPPGGEKRHAVLISIPQRIGGYAQDLLNLLEGEWENVNKPLFFRSPTSPNDLDKWRRCLSACEDYFGNTSREYRLLQKGIVAHHGKMPGIMARLLIQLVEDGIVHLILATSTLSEGVNLPFEVVLLPTLRRANDWITAREFANLAGRAGRPGYGTEGKCLVLLPADSAEYSANQQWRHYGAIINELTITPRANTAETGGRSALAELLHLLRRKWTLLTGSNDENAFLGWLEITVVLAPPDSDSGAPPNELTEILDSLDSVLLAAIVEIESLAGESHSAAQIEGKLIEIWRHCYAHYASLQESILSTWFLQRGRALITRIYPDATQRRKLYRSGLPPRLGDQLIRLYPTIRDHLLTGSDYSARDSQGQFQFICTLVELLGTHPKFALSQRTPGNTPWYDILRWWLDPDGPVGLPRPTQISEWYDYISTNFSYRFAWGVGSVLALAANEAHGDTLQPTTLDDWGDLGLPWIALWLKELIVWGTLDPVAAYLLGRGRAGIRTEARNLSSHYYDQNQQLDFDERLNPQVIRRWAETQPSAPRTAPPPQPHFPISVELTRIIAPTARRQWRVLPVDAGENIRWVDPAGYQLGSSLRPRDWTASLLDEGDFLLDADARIVNYTAFL
jgi:hypothetical protein